MNKRGTQPDKIDRLKPQVRQGLIVVITDNGKGKTTATLGMALRACGHGMKVCIIQFMKGDLYAGEWDGVKQMNCDIDLIATGKGFCGIHGNLYPWTEHRANAQNAIDLVREKIATGRYDLLILDEINNALKLKLVDLEQVLDLLQNKPSMLHLVLTGRDFHSQVELFRARTNLSIASFLIKVGKGESTDLWRVLLEAEQALSGLIGAEHATDSA